MSITYAYSFDRDTFTGSYNSRKEALAAAVEKAHEADASITSVFIGERVPGDPQANGHAREIVERMIDRARAAAGDPADSYLRDVTDPQLRDLDGAIEQVILRWQQLHQLKPAFDRITAISEHPLPMVSRVAASNGEADEVGELGNADYSFNP